MKIKRKEIIVKDINIENAKRRFVQRLNPSLLSGWNKYATIQSMEGKFTVISTIVYKSI